MRGTKTCNTLATFTAAKVAKKNQKPAKLVTEPSSFQTTSKHQVKCKSSQNNVDGEFEETGREHLRSKARVNYKENGALRQFSNGKISIKGKKAEF